MRYLNLIVDFEKRTIERRGFSGQPIDLGRADVSWYIFKLCYDHKGTGVPLEVLKDGYPDGNFEHRHRVKFSLNQKLKRYQITIENWQLKVRT